MAANTPSTEGNASLLTTVLPIGLRAPLRSKSEREGQSAGSAPRGRGVLSQLMVAAVPDVSGLTDGRLFVRLVEHHLHSRR